MNLKACRSEHEYWNGKAGGEEDKSRYCFKEIRIGVTSWLLDLFTGIARNCQQGLETGVPL